VLTESENARVYWRVFKKRLIDEGSNQTVTNGNALKMIAFDGKLRKTDCANTKGKIAGGARIKLEKRLGRSIISKQNFLPKNKTG